MTFIVSRTSSPSAPNRSPNAMSEDQTLSKPTDAEQESGKGLDGTPCSALAILQGCGLHGKHYNTVEKAAEGVRDIIRALRADLHDPPHDIQCAVLRKLGVEGFTKEGESPTRQLIHLPNDLAHGAAGGGKQPQTH